MSEYRRFIAYIYEYRNGKKEKNAGFVKAEVRNGRCRLWIQLQTGSQETQILDCYGFVRRQRQILGIRMGIGQLKQGRMELRLTVPEQTALQPFGQPAGQLVRQPMEQSAGQNVGETVRFAELAGLWIQGENRLFLTVWDEEPVDVSRFSVFSSGAGEEEPDEGQPEPLPKKEPDEGQPEPLPKKEPDEGQELLLKKEPNRIHLEDKKDRETGGKAVSGNSGKLQSREEERDTGKDTGKDAEKNADAPLFAAQDTSTTEPFARGAIRDVSGAEQSSREAIRDASTKSLTYPDTNLASRWRQFQYHYPKEYPFEDDEISECLRIALKDLDYLGPEGRIWCASPFVQQRYLKYRHLILGRHENGHFLLGVPGLNRNVQDVHLAAMYGFPEFKSGGDGSFGYWYRFL